MRRRQLEPVDELLALLEEQGVVDAPREGPHPALQGFLAFALHLAERQKGLGFEGFSWQEPRFVARDTKLDVTVLYAPLEGKRPEDVATTFEHHMARPHPPLTLLALDARASGITEYELAHHLYGEVRLHAFRVPVPHSQDARIEEARERGWTKTLKEHNLLPGRSLVVPDDKHGLYLTDPFLEDAVGALALLDTGEIPLMLNPFATRLNEPDMQHWLAWGKGVAASEWRTLVDVTREDD